MMWAILVFVLLDQTNPPMRLAKGKELLLKLLTSQFLVLLSAASYMLRVSSTDFRLSLRGYIMAFMLPSSERALFSNAVTIQSPKTRYAWLLHTCGGLTPAGRTSD